MRVCFVSSYPPNRARLSEYAETLVEELAKRPSIEKIYVIADKELYTHTQIITKKNPKIEIIRAWSADNPLSIFKVLYYANKLKPDVLHFNVHFQSYGKKRLANFTGFLLVPLSRLLHIKTVVLLHNLGEKVDLRKVNMKPSFVNRAGIMVATKMLLSAQATVVPVQFYAKFIRTKHHKSNVKYIPHGTATYTDHEYMHKEKRILMFGHMGPSKGLPVMLKAFKEITQKNRNVALIVAGSSHPNYPHYLDSLKKDAPANTRFLGYVPEMKLSNVFESSDLVVLPYLTATGTSGVFHMACGYGKPVVASNLPEIRELVDSGASAILVPPGNTESLKKAVEEVLSNERLASKMSLRNLFFAKKESWRSVAAAYEEVYLTLNKQKLTTQPVTAQEEEVFVAVPNTPYPLYEKPQKTKA
ncbi:glycosyltransferase [Candidatus Bathyarchaeota archaeon]|nr:glycosyltransferase [Candidatus Bathyarchaeota archaeon]